jgi:hypothetical protein
MKLHSTAVFACLLLAFPAAAQTIYKYRDADGKTTYSNRALRGATLEESFEYKFAAPAEPSGVASTSSKNPDARMKEHLAALEAAWNEVQAATKALAAAELRLSEGVGPLEGESTALGGPVALAPSELGGPQAAASPAMGGPQPPAAPAPGQTAAQAAAASRAVGGPMGTRRGGGRSAEYDTRMAALEANVVSARARLDAAQTRYNQLR